MKNRGQFALENELQRRARQLISVPEPREAAADVSIIFDLGSSGGSNIAQNKGQMISDAFNFTRRKLPTS
jgi:hypothetical protein